MRVFGAKMFMRVCNEYAECLTWRVYEYDVK